ncbi:hypothetical protein OOK36_55115 [Streptomyces sp. NBC_00365]|uniref:hypothetical protein n=1 Tax=Streptomyces sp. NBC_00365 TaxID=2975726 RepID=UPI002251AA2D|nr:hypothetical protein [Streptomyces sp. NBC_00365]MCX5097587.1 hypothetical protein [Streptomyces sp. NBC_00365]
MNTYKGKAVLLVEDGRKFDAVADLTKDQSRGWRGTLTFHDVPLIPVLLNVRNGHVLIDGPAGEFVRPNTSDWTPTSGGPLVMRILGSGDAPF